MIYSTSSHDVALHEVVGKPPDSTGRSAVVVKPELVRRYDGVFGSVHIIKMNGRVESK